MPVAERRNHVADHARSRPGRTRSPRRDRRRASPHRAGRGRDRFRERNAALRIGWAHGLPSAADARGLARDGRAGGADPSLLPRRGDQGRAARRRHLALRRRLAACRRRASRHGEVQSPARNRLRKSRRRGAAGRHQSRHHQGRGAGGLLLCARPVLADRLHHRRQCRDQFRRGALPEIRHDHEQRARRRDGADDGRDRPRRRQRARCQRLRPLGGHHRLGRSLGRRHRGDGAHFEET